MPQSLKSLVIGGISLFVLAILVFSSIYIVSEGERGVLTRNGAFVAVKEPGLGFKVPVIDSVTDSKLRNYP